MNVSGSEWITVRRKLVNVSVCLIAGFHVYRQVKLVPIGEHLASEAFGVGNSDAAMDFRKAGPAWRILGKFV